MGAGSLASSQQQPDNGPLILPDNKKEDRAKKGKYKPAKLELRPDEAATLENEITPVISTQLKALMFGKDFKQHCQAADLVRDAVGTSYDEVQGIADLLLRWSTLRVAEGNTQALVKVLDMLKELFAAMEQRGDKLSEYEAKCILPVLVEKAGHNQDKIKEMFRELLRRCASVCPPSRVAGYLKDGLDSKNNKTRVVVADELGWLISQHGPPIYRGSITASKIGNAPDSILISLAKLVSERDQSLRSAALGCFEVVYAFEADGLWRYLGKLTDASRTLVEERLKYTDKELAKKGLKPGYRAVEFGEEAPAPVAAPVPAATGLGAMRPASPRGVAPSPSSMRPPSPSGIRPPSPSGVRRSTNAIPTAPSPIAARPATAAAAGGSSILAGMRPASAAPALQPSAEPVLPGDQQAGLPVSDAAALAYLRSSSMVPHAASTNGSNAGGAGPVVSPMNSLSKTNEAVLRKDFARCMDALSGDDVEEAVGVMKLFCYELMDLQSPGGTGVAAAFRDNMDRLVAILAAKTDSIFSDAGASIVSQGSANVRACKYALNTLMNLFQYSWLAREPREPTLRHLMSVLLCCLVDERLSGLQEGVALLKALNLLMMKILENCNRTQVFTALIELLRTPYARALALGAHSGDAGRAAQEAKWYDLVVKCTIKLTKFLPATIEEIDLPSLLLAIHAFFDALGGEELRRRGAREDKPLRMVKTVLHEVCRLKGQSIFAYTKGIPGADLEPAYRPIIFPYIDLNLQTAAANNTLAPGATAVPAGGSTGAESAAAAASPAPVSRLPSMPAGGPGPAPSNVLAVNTNALNTGYTGNQPAAPTASPKLSAAAAAPVSAPAPAAAAPQQQQAGVAALQPSEEMYRRTAPDDAAARQLLATIFKRISENSDRQQALVDLWYFSAANPDKDVDSFLSSASATFKTFIMRGMKKINQLMAQQQVQAQQQAAQQPSSWGSGANSPDNEPASNSSQQAVPAVQPLNLAQLKLGASGGLEGAGSMTSPMSPSVKASARAAPVVGVDKIAELKERMNHITADVANMPLPSSRAPAPQGLAPSGTTSGRASGGANSGVNSGIPTPSLNSPSLSANDLAGEEAAAGSGNMLATLQERMRKLREQEAV
uniref:TOG domain-containing protein n=1 Tax=Chlamydomonas leiostraca TaxID=1034604 RepID=A0A7S0RW58_9CHLO